MESFHKHTECLISGSKTLKPLKKYNHAYLVKSKPAGFVFCERIPTPEELTTHYNLYGRNETLSPVTVIRLYELLDQFEKYRNTNRLLDVGCSIGLFLDIARQRGWEVYGTEYTDAAIRICEGKGIKMKKGKLNPGWFDAGSFDIVTSTEVIEHINNPVEEVRNIHKILRPGGLFYFTTPNFNALERYIIGPKYNIIEYPEHLSYYTKKTANYLLTKNGFKKRKLTTTGFSISRMRSSLQNNQTNAGVASADEVIRTKMEKNKLAKLSKRTINGLLNLFSIGNAMKGWYIKV
jgi:2-polyprenyl-3-methyl-5-hydroxy-6-metoxy-1,4-benzoquinol methylase